MKTLKQYADDLRATSQLLLTVADEIEAHGTEQARQLAAAFGIDIPEAPKSRSRPAKPKAEPADEFPTRYLNKEEKEAIRKDYEALHPNQRTEESRRALALKHRVSPRQVRAVVSAPVGRPEMKERMEKVRLAKATSNQPAPDPR